MVSGSQVLTALRRFESQAKDETIALKVQTGKNSTGQWYYSRFEADKVDKSGAVSDISTTTNVTHAEYINPSGMFAASVHRDSNGVIRAIQFVQEKTIIHFKWKGGRGAIPLGSPPPYYEQYCNFSHQFWPVGFNFRYGFGLCIESYN
ncbi:hypothetical protein OL548_34430 (plasmid) [Lysinibacillus sp. MHQ-1]|nr:hypothetical protein OL548_34430 [Lysinibacillus sp. MHQ-1]